MSQRYRDTIIEQLSEIDDAIYSIIEHCKSGNYSMNEIAAELEELRSKVY